MVEAKIIYKIVLNVLFRQRFIFFVTMPDDAISHSVTCGCDCQPETFHASEAVDEEFRALCDCFLCGAGRCSVEVDYAKKVAWIIKRGYFTFTNKQLEAAPRYCGCCMDYHDLKEIQRQKEIQKPADSHTPKRRTLQRPSQSSDREPKRHRETTTTTG